MIVRMLQYMRMADTEPRISWKIEEYIHREKSIDWYWALGVIAIAGAIMSIIYHDIFFAIFILLGAGILGFYANRKPELIDVAISADGITIRNYFYPYTKLKGFSIDIHHLSTYLLLESDRPIIPLLSVPLPETIDKEALAELLRTKIPEKKLEEPMAHRIMEHLGF